MRGNIREIRMRGLIYYLILLPILRIKRLSDSMHLFMYIKHHIRAMFCETVDYNDTREEINGKDDLSSKAELGNETPRNNYMRRIDSRGNAESVYTK